MTKLNPLTLFIYCQNFRPNGYTNTEIWKWGKM